MEFLSIKHHKFPTRVLGADTQITANDAKKMCPSSVNLIGAYGYFEGPMFIGSYIFADENKNTYRIKMQNNCDTSGKCIDGGTLVLSAISIPNKDFWFNFMNPFRAAVVIDGIYDAQPA
jgi:hypothetical protein